MKTDAQLYNIIWTLTKEEKITLKIAIFVRISVRTWCRNRNTGRSSLV